jgi:hypothetical protein
VNAYLTAKVTEVEALLAQAEETGNRAAARQAKAAIARYKEGNFMGAGILHAAAADSLKS